MAKRSKRPHVLIEWDANGVSYGEGVPVGAVAQIRAAARRETIEEVASFVEQWLCEDRGAWTPALLGNAIRKLGKSNDN